MGHAFILSIDLGTSGCKAIIVDEQGKVVRSEGAECPLSAPRPGWSEQDPANWWAVAATTVKRLLGKMTVDERQAIQAIGLSGQMHGLVALDQDGRVLRPCILWNDQRCAPQCLEVYDLVGGPEKLLLYTNNSMLPGYTAGKVLWVRENEPQVYERIATILLPKDYLRYRLCGEIATDVSDASGTGLFDVRTRRWSHAILDRLELPREWFPPVYESTEAAGRLSDRVADELGLPRGLLVAAGGGDAVMQTLGSGVVSEETALVVIGTGGNVSVCAPSFHPNPGGKLQFFCNGMPSKYVALGVTLSAGSCLRWFRDNLGRLEQVLAEDARVSAYELLDRVAEGAPPGAHGLIFLPYLSGERCPHPDPDARGCLVGLSLHSSRSDIVRSIYEGVAYSLRDVLQLMGEVGLFPQRICVSGGGARSTLWRQILADVFGQEIFTVTHSADAAALGAALAAGVGVGMWATVEEMALQLEVEDLTRPAPENAEAYTRMFDLYKTLYRALGRAFHELAGNPSR